MPKHRTHVGHPSPVCTVNKVRIACGTLSYVKSYGSHTRLRLAGLCLPVPKSKYQPLVMIIEHSQSTSVYAIIEILLAFFRCQFGQVRTMIELSLEQLHGDNGENELKEHVDNSREVIETAVRCNEFSTYKMVKTLDNDVITQSKTALSFGTRLMVFNGRRTRRTRKDLIVFRFLPAPFSLFSSTMIFPTGSNGVL